MKKHAFKRITPMVLVFVMCVFLMPTNSLGVKAVTADDVLVEESQVSSEITAENPASEVEVITSEEAELPVEELASDEVIDEASEEIGDVEPLDVLSENGTILLADEATEEWSLTYDDTTEIFASFAELSARINELNNAESVYTITCTKPISDYLILDGFPSVAKELIFQPAVTNSGSFYILDEITTDIKVTMKAEFHLSEDCTFDELLMDGGSLYYFGGSEAGITLDVRELTLVNNSWIMAFEPIEIETCNIDENSELAIGWSTRWDSTAQDYIYYANGYYDITTLNLLGQSFHFSASNSENLYSVGDVALTTSSVITDANVKVVSSDVLQGRVVANGDGTYSIVLAENTSNGYALSYGSVVEEYLTYDDVLERIEERNNVATTYKIQPLVANDMDIYELPTKAKSVIFLAPETNDATFLSVNGVSEGCPIEFKGWANVTLNNCKLENVTNTDSFNYLYLFEGCEINKLTISSAIYLCINGRVSIETLSYKCNDAYGWAQINFYRGEHHDINDNITYTYGTAKINSITIASGVTRIDVGVYYAEMQEEPIIEYVKYNADVWKIFSVKGDSIPAGYALGKSISSTGSRTIVWEEDVDSMVELQYGSTTEKFRYLQDAFNRIETINDADNSYTVTVLCYNESLPEFVINNFPNAVKSLTIVNKAGINSSVGINDMDGSIHCPVTFVDFHINLFGGDLNTKDFTIESQKQQCAVFINSNLNCEGIFYLNGADYPRIGGAITADTFKWKPASAQSATTNLFMLTSEGPGGKIIADNLDIADGYRLKLSYERFDNDMEYMVINQYSEDCQRVDMVCNYTDEEGNVYEGVMKVQDSGECTYSRQIQQPYYYVTDSDGNTFINSRSWFDVQNAFKLSGDKTKTYTIEVVNGRAIGELPINAASLVLQGDDCVPDSIIKVSAATLEVKVPVCISNTRLEYGTNGAKVNVKVSSGALILDNVSNVGTISGNNKELGVYGDVEVVKIDKLKSLYVADDASLTVSGDLTNIATLGLDGIIYAWGNITVTDIGCDDEGALHYQLSKKLTINGTVTFEKEDYTAISKIYLYPYTNSELITSYTDDMAIIDVCAKADVSDFSLIGMSEEKALYRAKTEVKIGTPKIYVFETGNWEREDASNGKPFVTINDAIDHINEEPSGYYAIRLEDDIPSAGTIKSIKTNVGKMVVIGAHEDTPHILNFTGTMIIDRCGVEIRNVDLRNSASANASVTVKSNGYIKLYNTAINALTTEAGTKVYIENDANSDIDVVIKGTVKCNGEFVVKDGAVFWCKSAVTVKDFTLDGENAQLRILTGKSFTINGNVNIDEEEGSALCINVVDKNGNLATIKAGTTMVTAVNGTIEEFTTQNIMAGMTDTPWLLTKSGKAIKTAKLVAYVYEPAEVTANDKYYPFASFNEAKAFVANGEGYRTYYIELVSDSIGADLTDLPSNLLGIRVHKDATADKIKLTAKTDIEFSISLELENVNIVASGKTIYADGGMLNLYNSDITAGRADRIDWLYVENGTATFTSKTGNTMNYIEVYAGGCLKCPAFSGFEP